MKTLFNHENYASLCAAIGLARKNGDVDAADDEEAVKRAAKSMLKYVEAVTLGDLQMKVAYARFEGDELRETVKNIDTTRRILHEGAMAHVSMLNRISAFYECGDIFLGNPKDRYEVADFCQQLVDVVFEKDRLGRI